MLEQRKSARRRTLLDGRLHIEKLNGWMLDCCVRNVSDSGARIALQTSATIPQTFDLAISGREPRQAHLVWHANGHAGVTYTPPTANDAPSDAPRAAAAPTGDMLQIRIKAIASRRQASTGFLDR